MPSLPFDHAAQTATTRDLLRPSCVKCLITGADLVGPGFWQHGDLFLVGDCYVFNACGEPQHETYAEDGRVIQIDPTRFHENYFERRNVYVIPRAEAALNEAAATYVGEH